MNTNVMKNEPNMVITLGSASIRTRNSRPVLELNNKVLNRRKVLLLTRLIVKMSPFSSIFKQTSPFFLSFGNTFTVGRQRFVLF